MNYSDEYNEKWDSYMYPDGITLKNKLGITDHDELAKKDAEISFVHLRELQENPIEGNFDVKHLRNIHKYLFDDLYDWAGEFRTIYMTKPECVFAPVKDIPGLLDSELKLLNKELEVVNKDFNTASLLAKHYISIQHIHPFREGNSRSIREFFNEFINVKSNGLINLSFSSMNKDVMATARKYSTKDTPGEIAIEFYNALKENEQIRNR